LAVSLSLLTAMAAPVVASPFTGTHAQPSPAAAAQDTTAPHAQNAEATDRAAKEKEARKAVTLATVDVAGVGGAPQGAGRQ
jgi:hypothetical protein